MTKDSISNQWEKNETFNKCFWEKWKNRQKKDKTGSLLPTVYVIATGSEIKTSGYHKKKRKHSSTRKTQAKPTWKDRKLCSNGWKSRSNARGDESNETDFLLFSNNIRKTTRTKQPFCMASAPPASLVLILATTEVTSLAQALTYLPCPCSGRCHGLWENSPQWLLTNRKPHMGALSGPPTVKGRQ